MKRTVPLLPRSENTAPVRSLQQSWRGVSDQFEMVKGALPRDTFIQGLGSTDAKSEPYHDPVSPSTAA